jgi:hypothetical protein
MAQRIRRERANSPAAMGGGENSIKNLLTIAAT